MGAMHQEASGRHRPQPRQARRHPVARRDRLDDERARRGGARDRGDDVAQRGRVGRLGEMHLDAPAAGRVLKGRHHGFA